MKKDTPIKRWLLLDPPCSTGYARRVSMREKEDAPDAPFPSIDLILLSGSLQDAGFEPVYLDAQINHWDWPRVLCEVKKLNVSGIVTLLSSSKAQDELSSLKDLRDALDGVPTYAVASIYFALDQFKCRALVDAHPWLDGMILNTAENNFGRFVAGLDNEPHNLVIRRHGKLHLPKVSVSYGEELHIPTPTHAVFKDTRYYFPQSKRTPVTCVQMSFGCPYTCEFCLDNALYRKMRYRVVDDVVKEMVDINRLGFREVYFKDLTFGLSKRVTVDFLEKLSAKRLRLRWLCTSRVDVMTPRLLKLMKRAGCYGIEFGVESGLMNRRALNGKRITDEQIKGVFKQCRALGIETTAFVMIGFEDETEAEIRTTMRFIESIRPDYASYNIVNALPGTALERRAKDEGFLRKNNDSSSFATSNIKHRYLTPRQLEDLRVEAVRSFYRRPSAVMSRLLRVKSVFELMKLVRMGRAAIA